MADNDELIQVLIIPAIVLVVVFMVAVVYGAVSTQISGGFEKVAEQIWNSFLTAVLLVSAVGSIVVLRAISQLGEAR